MRKSKWMLPGLALSALLMAAPLSASAAAAKTVPVAKQAVTMNFDGQALALPTGQSAFTYQSRIYIPLRFVSYALQKNVVWTGSDKTVTVSEPTSSQAVVLSEYLMNAASSAKAGVQAEVSGKMNVTPVQVKFVFDGAEKTLPEGQQAFSLNGTIYVPIRFISESAGTTINWDAKTKGVYGQSKAYQEAHGNGSASNGNNGSSGSEDDGSGAAGGGGGAAQTVDEVKAQTQATLETLETNCVNSIVGLIGVYTGDELTTQANAKLAACTSQFESAMSSAEANLRAAGDSEDDIAATLKGYRDTFNAEQAKYRQMAEDYLGIKV